MKLPFIKPKKKRSVAFIGPLGDEDSFCFSGYKSLKNEPAIATACQAVAETIGMMTIQILQNTDGGDKRIINELSRTLDIAPNPYMTRKTMMETNIMNLLLYGDGNAVMRPHTKNGYLERLEIIQPDRVTFVEGKDRESYMIKIDGIPYDPGELIHFVLNPDEYRPWKGQGLRVNLREVADNLAQEQATKNGFLRSKFNPSVIVKVDALTEEFSSPEGRKKLAESYLNTSEAGEPWIIPAEQFQVEQIRPLTLNDLAISESIQVDRRTAAAIVGVPPFIIGAGDYDQAAWNNFINRKVKSIATGIQQELTRKLIISPKWHIRLNSESLNDWDLDKIASVYFQASDRGFVSGNEVRDKIHLEPKEGLDEYRTLENYIPNDMLGKQKKLITEEEE